MMQNNMGNILQVVKLLKLVIWQVHEYSLRNLKIGGQRLVLLS